MEEEISEFEVMLKVKAVEAGLQELKAEIMKKMTEKYSKGEDVTQLQKSLEKTDEYINKAINIYHEEEN
ncbi:hypothetical protein ACDN41_11870 [Priestia aryabhattai]|uniref:hypothetical protein n=1 Tax=Priestia aryabhattai TaxID=412384 RepID=UPI00353201A2